MIFVLFMSSFTLTSHLSSFQTTWNNVPLEPGVVVRTLSWRGSPTKQAQRKQSFLERAGSTKPKSLNQR